MLVITAKCFSDAPHPYCVWGNLLKNLLGVPLETKLTYKDFVGLLSARVDFEQISGSVDFLAKTMAIEPDYSRPKTLLESNHLLEIQIAFQLLFELLSDKEKLVVIIDDFQWIDDECLRVLNALFRNCVTEYPILFVLSRRNREEGNGTVSPALNPDFVRIEHIYLKGISIETAKQISTHLIAETTGNPCRSIKEDLLSFLFYTSEENPLFLKHSINDFLRTGRISLQNEAAAFADETVLAPASLSGNALFRACVKDYSDDKISILRAASVLGVEFSLKELQLLLRYLNRNYNHKTLETFISEIDILEYSHRSYSSLLHFQHALIRDCIYDDIPPIEKQLLHRTTAGVLIKMRFNDNENISGLIAYHYLNGNDKEQTIKWGTKAFHKAKRAYQNNKALLWADTLVCNLKETGAPPGELFNILDSKSEILDMQGRRDEQQATIEQMRAIATETRDEHLIMKSDYKYAWLLCRTGEFNEAELILAGIMENAPADSPKLIYSATSALATICAQQGRLHESLSYHREAQRMASESCDSEREARILINMAGVLKSLGRFDDSGRCYSKSLDYMKKTGNRRMRGIIHGNLAVLCSDQKKFDEAMQNYSKALEIARAIGDHKNEGTILGNLAVLYENMGRTDEAKDIYEQSLEIAVKIRNRKHEGILLANIAVINLKKEEFDAAEELLLQAQEIASSTGDNALMIFLSVALADVYFNTDNLPESVRCFNNACSIIEKYNFGKTANYECLLDLRERALKAGNSPDKFPCPANWEC